MALAPKLLPFIAAISCVSSGAALAQTACSGAIDQLTRQHNLTMEAPQNSAAGQAANQAAPPATMESRGLTATQPPPGSTGAFTPPPPAGSGSSLPPPGAQHLPPPGAQQMPAPGAQQLAPPQTIAPRSGAVHSDLGAADRGRMEALLKAARDADRRGDSQHCLELLRQAQATPGVSGTGRPQ